MSRYDDGYGDDRRNDRGYYAGGGERERGGYAPAERERVPAAYEERCGGVQSQLLFFNISFRKHACGSDTRAHDVEE